MVSRQQLLLSILLERCRVAKTRHLLSFSKCSRVACSQPASRNVGDGYIFHSDNFNGMCLQLSPLKPFSRSLRYCFGELCYNAVAWYVRQLRFPDLPVESTRGLEHVLDVELATAVLLRARRRVVFRRMVLAGDTELLKVLCSCLTSSIVPKCNMTLFASPGLRSLAIVATCACVKGIGILVPFA